MTISQQQSEAATLEHVLTAREKAVAWLEHHLDADGAVTDGTPALAARGPLALVYAGRYDLAARHLGWLAGLDRQELTFGEGTRYGSYGLALLAQGAVAASRWDIARQLHEELAAWLAPCGAPWSRTSAGCGETEVVVSAQAGITLLALGDLERANRIGEHLCEAWRAQPSPEERFFMLTDGEGQLLTELPAGIDDDERAHRVVERTGRRQHFFVGGILAAFLVQIHWATGQREPLDVARACQAFAMGQTHQFETLQVCKTGWGSAFLSVATGEASYRAWTERLGAWFADTQLDDGSWTDHNAPYGGGGGAFAVTAEFLQHLTFVAWALGHRS